jgi:hypothetical protein
MRYALHRLATDVGVGEAVRFDDRATVGEKGEAPVVLFEPARRFCRVVLRDTEKDRVLGFDRLERLLQLTELPFAVRSPTAAAEELENDGLVAPIARELVGFAGRVTELEIRRGVSNVHAGLAEDGSR